MQHLFAECRGARDETTFANLQVNTGVKTAGWTMLTTFRISLMTDGGSHGWKIGILVVGNGA